MFAEATPRDSVAVIGWEFLWTQVVYSLKTGIVKIV